MRQLMCHHAGHLFARQLLQEPRGGRDGGVLRVAAGGKGVRLRVVDDVDLRHRQAGPPGKLLHDRIIFRRRARVDFARTVHAQDQLVGVPVAEQIHGRRDQEGNQRAVRATDQIADAHEQRRQQRQQHGRLHHVHRSTSSRRPFGAGLGSRHMLEEWTLGSMPE